MGLIAFNKPFGVLCQFTDPDGRPNLSDYIDQPGYYPAGRLDLDSEGLLLLTDDGALQARITQPGEAREKVYLAQVEGTPATRALQRLRAGVKLKDGVSRPARVELLAKAPPWLWPRQPPIRQNRKIPTAWLKLGFTEGRNRQVRRTLAHVDLPVLRLVRESVAEFSLDGLEPGEQRYVQSGLMSKA